MPRNIRDILAKAESASGALDETELATLLSLPDESDEEKMLFDCALGIKRRIVGNKVSIRGLIEAGNICSKDCLYCGIRKSNSCVERYSLAADDIVRLAYTAKEFRYASIVIQSGEIESDAHTAFIEEVLQRIAPLDLGVTLSLGEQSQAVYRRWKEAGATRYLLRIETSNRELYSRLHPADHSWDRRVECLKSLGALGWQLGTGVMCALPGQTALDLARDIVFYRDIGADMIGMGPYIPHEATPLAADALASGYDKHHALHLGLKMIAATRLMLHDVNIAAATALQALADDGREQGILAGANVIMPNITDVRYRSAYKLYDNKPCTGESAALCRSCLDRRIAKIGEVILYCERGDSIHYAKKSRSNQ